MEKIAETHILNEIVHNLVRAFTIVICKVTIAEFSVHLCHFGTHCIR